MHQRFSGLLVLGAVALSACQESITPPASDQTQTPSFTKAPAGSPATIKLMEDINQKLRARGLSVAVEAIEFFTIGEGRPSNRIHQQEFRWVSGDPRRLADGNNITYLVDQSDGHTASGLTNLQTEAALDRSFFTWENSKPFQKVNIVKRADTGVDPDIFDSFFGFGSFGQWWLADIVEAGWLPRAFFEAVGGPGGGRGILAFSVTFIFQDPATGIPTDLNGDNYLDTALNEVYYNDNFGHPGGDRPTRPWAIDIGGLSIDVETVGLHENGHSLGVGHFGPPPAAVMNPVYAGILHEPLSTDLAGMSTIWSRWPN